MVPPRMLVWLKTFNKNLTETHMGTGLKKWIFGGHSFVSIDLHFRVLQQFLLHHLGKQEWKFSKKNAHPCETHSSLILSLTGLVACAKHGTQSVLVLLRHASNTKLQNRIVFSSAIKINIVTVKHLTQFHCSKGVCFLGSTQIVETVVKSCFGNRVNSARKSGKLFRKLAKLFSLFSLFSF